MTVDLAIERVPYADTDDGPLHLHVYRPRHADGPRPALLDLHGGAWSHFDPSVDFYWCEELARRGYVVASAEFRLAPRHRWPACLQDARAAARFLRANAVSLGIDAQRLAAIGGSTGGHLATMLALWPNEPDAAPTPARGVDPSVSSHVTAAIALWPILDVPGRYHLVCSTRFGPLARSFARRAAARGQGHPPLPTERLRRLAALRRRSPRLGNLVGDVLQQLTAWAGRLPPTRAVLYDALRRGHDNAFADTAAMHRACPTHRLLDAPPERTPPLLIVLGTADTNTTEAMTRGFVERYAARGGDAALVLEPGLGHSYGNLPSRAADRLINRIDDFLQRLPPGPS